MTGIWKQSPRVASILAALLVAAMAYGTTAWAQESGAARGGDTYDVDSILDTLARRSHRNPAWSGVLQKWQSPIAAVVSMPAAMPVDEKLQYVAAIQASFKRLSQATEVRISLLQRGTFNYIIWIYEDIYALPQEKIARIYEPLFDRSRKFEDLIQNAQSQGAGCFADVGGDDDGALVSATLFVSLKHLKSSVRRCLNYLTAYSMGAFGKPPHGTASIFAYPAGDIEDLTDFDTAVLEFLYRNDIKPGTHRDDVAN